MNGARNVIFFGHAPWGPGEGSKGQISLNFNYKVNVKDFYSKLFVCSHNERYKTYQTGFSLYSLGHTPGVEIWGTGGAHSVNFFFKHGHVAYQIGDDKQNRMQVTVSF